MKTVKSLREKVAEALAGPELWNARGKTPEEKDQIHKWRWYWLEKADKALQVMKHQPARQIVVVQSSSTPPNPNEENTV